ncbi:169_t:CDS:2 [Paraglomus occultum]|uniref:169_t:CDS:1 n=1 Tax=Paraglomus occultum TaxID=144539 RepID=A0A9N9CZ45_9GLOM|nr:169_t:CDS:2 [Paraglomus occultum]
MRSAVGNDGLTGLSKQQVLEKLITTTEDIHTLARTIIYYKLLLQFKVSLKQIHLDYNQYYYPEAENFLIKHLKILISAQYDDALFIQNTDTPTSQENKENTDTLISHKNDENILTSPKETEEAHNNTTSTSSEKTNKNPFQYRLFLEENDDSRWAVKPIVVKDQAYDGQTQ